ncbi:sulfate adenylyltransferase [Veronia nyctiphanis]|uniref:Sulfate adenylyltransferase n=1 Tax=Veronia nyctiphanis TaxID=1278244 RepID=A0A4Q0YNA8_9GAMM|nr:transglutaminase-like cysteine peptidase [Veronia nyctiphanis]RXJ71885.1 sulfate adenylyltransferase [Veronia nyctiphanis]
MRTLVLLCLTVASLVVGTTASEIFDKELINKVQQTYGDQAVLRTKAWQTLVTDNQHLPDEEKLHLVNAFFNQLHFVDDLVLWGQEDYWATPIEMIGSNAGDCEDFTIAKYFTLRELGIDDDKLRLIYVKALNLNQFHMVLAYYPRPGDDPLLLDNLDPEIKDASKRQDLFPVYSFNGSRLWLLKERGREILAGKSSRLSLWNDVKSRIRSSKMKKAIVNYNG